MQANIGGIAGEIWQILGTKGEMPLTQLPRSLKHKGEVVYQGLGWLAREGKVNYVTRSGKTFVALTDTERDIFRETNLRAKNYEQGPQQRG